MIYFNLDISKNECEKIIYDKTNILSYISFKNI